MLLQTRHYYDIFHLGLRWLALERDAELELTRPRSFAPLLYALREIGLIDDAQCRAALKDKALLQMILRKLDVIKRLPGDSRDEAYARHPEPGFKNFRLVLPTDAVFDRSRILGRRGYMYRLTTAGVAYVEKKQTPYADIVTAEQFLTGWRTMKERVERLMRARYVRARLQAIESEDSEEPSIDELE